MPLIPGISDNLAGSLFTGLTSLFGGAAANVSREQQAAQQMQFQERMSSTAYQRAMQDMREAGLNPMLAAKVGPASSPVGAMANIQDIGTPAAQAATSAYQAQTQRRQQEQSEQLIASQVEKITSDISVNEATKARMEQDVLLMHARELTEGQLLAMYRETAAKLKQEVGTQEAIKLLKQMELRAYQFVDSKVLNPYTGKLFLEYKNGLLDALEFLVQRGKRTKTTTYVPGGKVEVTR
jgi:hypothetical protein